MKKLVVGFIAGAVFASSTVVYAGEAIKAVIFPVKYKVNGVNIDLPDGYQSINVDGRAYVPIRFAAESLNVVVAYDEASKTIQMDSGFDLPSINTPIRAGYIEVVKQGNISKVKGKLYIGQSYWDALHNSKMEVKPGSEVDFKAGIAFYNDESKLLGVTPISMSLIAKGDQIKSFEIVTDQDVSGYTYASLQNIQPEPIYAFLPPSPFLDDPTGKVTIEDYNAVKTGDFSKMRFMLGILKTGIYRVEGVLTYYDETDKVIGTADIIFKGKGLDENRNGSRIMYETAGKGDLTKAKRVTLTINKFEPINEIEPN